MRCRDSELEDCETGSGGIEEEEEEEEDDDDEEAPAGVLAGAAEAAAASVNPALLISLTLVTVDVVRVDGGFLESPLIVICTFDVVSGGALVVVGLAVVVAVGTYVVAAATANAWLFVDSDELMAIGCYM